MNENRPSTTIVYVDNADVAASVIRSLRSSSNSSRAYKQNAMDGEFLIQNVQSLNKVIEERSVEVNKIKAHERQLNESLAAFKPNMSPSRGDAYNSSSSDTHPKPVRRGYGKNDNDDEDDEYMGLSSDDEREEHKGSDHNPQEHPMYPLPQAALHINIKRTTSDEDLLNDNDDDEDNDALFANFVAPSSGISGNTKVTGKGKGVKGVTNHTDNTHGKVFSVSNKKSIKRSGVSGRGGIRGIQELLSSSTLEDSSLSGSCSSPNLRTSSAGGSGGLGSSTSGDSGKTTNKASLVPSSSQQAARVASLVANAKPGQPIRIRAHGK